MQTATIGERAHPERRDEARAAARAAAIAAAFLGAFLIWGVGFSHIAALHNAAHDFRHSMAFPCH